MRRSDERAAMTMVCRMLLTYMYTCCHMLFRQHTPDYYYYCMYWCLLTTDCMTSYHDGTVYIHAHGQGISITVVTVSAV